MEIDYSFDDEYDRYKIVKPIVQKHKRSFFIQNLNKVADNLQVQDIYIVKYISMKAKCSYEKYSKQNYLINSPLVQIQVEEYIDEFINIYLKCHICKLLEFKIKVDKVKNIVQSKCYSCGANKIYNINDQMTDFIFKNPPIEKKKHVMDQNRGFLNELNDDYDFSEDENEDIQYSYEDDDSDSNEDEQSDNDDEEQKNKSEDEIYDYNEILNNQIEDNKYESDESSTETTFQEENEDSEINYTKQQKQSINESEEDNQKTYGDALTESSDSLNFNQISNGINEFTYNEDVVKNVDMSMKRLNEDSFKQDQIEQQ